MNKTKKEIYEQVSQPHDTETERAVLSTLMRYNDKIALYSDLLDVNLFYYDKEKDLPHNLRCGRGWWYNGHQFAL